MGSPDEVDKLLALGSERPPKVEACVGETSIDDGDLLAYRRGLLSEEKRDAVEEHLVACPFCRDLAAHIDVGRKGRRWPALLLGAAALVAATFLFVVTPPPKEPIGRYHIAKIKGEDSVFRGVELTKVEKTFNPNSQVAIKVEPQSGRAASMVRMFRIEDGVLVDVPAEIKPGEAGVFWIKASGRTLFGDMAGSKHLVIVAADEGADLSRIAGRTMIAAQALTTQAFWLRTLEVEYQVD